MQGNQELDTPTSYRLQKGIRGVLFRIWKGKRLRVAPASRLDIQKPYTPSTRSLELLFRRPSCYAEQLALLQPTVQGKIFKGSPIATEALPPESKRTSLGDGSSTRREKHKDDVIDLNILYELLYPPVSEAAIDIRGFDDLYPYQVKGVQFLCERWSALLADDMGLGKTVQCAIAVAILLKQQRIDRALIICPRAVIRQWKQEAHRWGGLSATIIEGSQEQRKSLWKYKTGLILTTPHIVYNDSSYLQKEVFDLVVCDDIGMLKNPGQIAESIRKLRRHASWCLNGTPLENKPEDVLNIMEFVCPGLFSYTERQKGLNASEVHRRISPYFLRRRKTDYLDLPPKVPIGPIEVELEGEQLRAYREAEIREWHALQESGIRITQIHIFSVINSLIRLCNYHPPSGTSAKLEVLEDEIDIVLNDSDNRAIVFAHDVEALMFIQKKLSRYSPLLYHGGLSDSERARVLENFRGPCHLLLASVKAGGKGLNLQQASYVFHFDRTWNPVDEIQAEDRCYRIGQKNTLFVYRYRVKDTIEERIDEVLSKKIDLFKLYIDSQSDTTILEREFTSKVSLEDLLEIVRPPKSIQKGS
ncbi:MAG TPA: DEAD/DEAH box helicase [Fimbriimonadales bacterium]|nr:DEAD/DEAH box helicase [Fimbriimonadales bacterium]